MAKNVSALMRIFILTAALVAAGLMARAQDSGIDHYGVDHWYHLSCCSRNDCQPIPASAVSVVEGGIRVVLQSWQHTQIPDGKTLDTVVADASELMSQDGENHACVVWNIGASQPFLRCLYVAALF